MFPEKEETLRRLEFEAVRLHKIQIMVREGAACARLLHEINSAEKALASVRNGLLRYNLTDSLSVLQDSQDIETQMKELRKIFEIFSESPNF